MGIGNQQRGSRITRRLTLAACAALVALVPKASQAQELAPRVEHVPLARAVRGEPITLRAQISSPIGKPIIEATAFVRIAGVKRFARVALQPDAMVKDLFAATVPAALSAGDFDYYLEAFDADGNGPGQAGSAEQPFHVVIEAPPPAPLVSDRPVAPAPPPVLYEAPSEPRSHTTTAVFGTIGGMAMGSGGILYLVFDAMRDRLEQAYKTNTTIDASVYGDAQTFGTLTTIALAVGGVALTIALTSAVWPEEEPRRLHLVQQPLPGPARERARAAPARAEEPDPFQ